jgi:hypothetical protein
MTCTDFIPGMMDGPGVCRVSCGVDKPCPDERYCSATNDVCRDDGGCFDHFDCEAEGNSFAHEACEGYGVCTAGTCSWTCGDPACRDLGSAYLDWCYSPLGWAVVSGACAEVYGCESSPYVIYATEEACNTACL